MTLERICICLKFTNKANSLCNIIVKILCIEKFNTIFVPFTENLFKNVNIIIFTTKSKHKNTACVGMIYKSAKHELSGALVITELGTTKWMRKMKCPCFFCNLLCHFINATNSYNNPNVISDSYIAIFSYISHKGAAFIFFVNIIECRFIGIFKIARKVCLDIMIMNVLSLGDINNRMSDWVTVFYNVFSRLDITERVFVPVLKIDINIVKFIN